MSSRTLRKDVSEIPVLVEPAPAPDDERAAETFVPRPSEPASAESQPAGSQPDKPQTAEPESAEPQPDQSPAADDASAAGGHPLSERERALLTFEKQNWKHAGAKDQAIRDRFELSATRYYQLLNSLLDRPEAQEFEPALVKRLRRIRAANQRARSGRARSHPA
jgi:uncharacterized protein DUF3263